MSWYTVGAGLIGTAYSTNSASRRTSTATNAAVERASPYLQNTGFSTGVEGGPSFTFGGNNGFVSGFTPQNVPTTAVVSNSSLDTNGDGLFAHGDANLGSYTSSSNAGGNNFAVDTTTGDVYDGTTGALVGNNYVAEGSSQISGLELQDYDSLKNFSSGIGAQAHNTINELQNFQVSGGVQSLTGYRPSDEVLDLLGYEVSDGVAALENFDSGLDLSDENSQLSELQRQFSLDAENPGKLLELSSQAGELLPTVQAGSSEMREARLGQIDNAETQALSDLKESAARRRISGSSFADDGLARTQLEAAQLRGEAEAQSTLEELEATSQILSFQSSLITTSGEILLASIAQQSANDVSQANNEITEANVKLAAEDATQGAANISLAAENATQGAANIQLGAQNAITNAAGVRLGAVNASLSAAALAQGDAQIRLAASQADFNQMATALTLAFQGQQQAQNYILALLQLANGATSLQLNGIQSNLNAQTNVFEGVTAIGASRIPTK